MKFIPETILPDNIYIPFYSINKKIQTINNFQIENNIILLGDEFPYFDMSDYSYDTHEWFWFDSNNFPYDIKKIDDYFVLYNKYGIGDNINTPLRIETTKLLYEQNGKKLGFYIPITIPEIKIYTGNPIILEINGEALIDKTDYYNNSNDIILTNKNVLSNKEFYYDFKYNKIVTNQNLSSFDLSQCKIYYYSIPNNISINCKLSSNKGINNFSSPFVDYYIVKLHGQYLG